MNKYGIINIILFVAVTLVLNCTVTKPLPPAPELEGKNKNLCDAGFNCNIENEIIYKIDTAITAQSIEGN